MGKQSKQTRVKTKQYTRAQAINALKNGSKRPEEFFDVSDPYRLQAVLKPGQDRGGAQHTVNHNNVHVRQLCWKMLGSPLPDDAEEQKKLLASLHIKEKAEAVEEPTAEEVNGDQ